MNPRGEVSTGKAIVSDFVAVPGGEVNSLRDVSEDQGGAMGGESGSSAVTGQRGSLAPLRNCTCGAYFRPAKWNQVYCSRKCSDDGYNAAHPVTRRPPDPAQKQRAIPGESRVERAFAAWIASEDGQVVEAEVIRRAMLLRSRGYLRWGIASLWESIRYDHTLALKGEAGAWRLNNSYRSLLARKVMQDVPQLAGFFSTRDLRGRVA